MDKPIERITANVLPAHKQALERMAAREDLPAAAVLRRLIRSEAQRQGLWPADISTPTPLPAPARDGTAA